MARAPRRPVPRFVLPLLGLALVALAQLACVPGVDQASGRPQGEAPTRRTDEGPSRSVAALGRIEPHGGIYSLTGMPGSRVGELKVKEGQQVERGDVLFVLDSHPALVATAESAAATAADARRLTEIEEESRLQLEGDLRLKQEQVETIDPLDLDAQKLRLEALQKAEAAARADLQRVEGVRKASSMAVSKQELDVAQLQVDRTAAEVGATEVLLRKGQLGLDLARRKLASDRKALELATRRAQLAAQLLAAEAGARAAAAQRDAAEIRAPIKGQVLRINTGEGEAVGPGSVIDMGDTEHMVVIAEVSELDLLRLREAVRRGPVRVVATGLGDGLRLEGTATADGIGRIVGRNEIVSLNPAAPADRRVVEVEVELDAASNEKARGLSNLQVDVDLEIRPTSASTESIDTARARP